MVFIPEGLGCWRSQPKICHQRQIEMPRFLMVYQTYLARAVSLSGGLSSVGPGKK